MKKTILTLLIAISLFGCKKKEEVDDNSLKTVTYTFAPNGANSEIIYKSIQQGTQVNAGYKLALFSVNDQVKIGDKTTLIMSTTAVPPSNYEIRISYGGKQIASASKNQGGGSSSGVVLEKTFTSTDFK